MILVTMFESSISTSQPFVVYRKLAKQGRWPLERKLTGAKVLGIQNGTEGGVGDLVIRCQAKSYSYVLDGLDVILGQDGDAEAGTRGDGASWDGDAVDAGGGEGGEEGKGGGEDGLGTHGWRFTVGFGVWSVSWVRIVELG